MGFQLLNLDGMLLRRIKRFKLLCKGCHKINLDCERLFCDSCGGAHLTKVSVYLNANGELTYFNNPKRKINLKGTVYSIPKPIGGRGCKDLILREDDLLKGEYK
jgi:RNA-binding protein NOB1